MYKLFGLIGKRQLSFKYIGCDKNVKRITFVFSIKYIFFLFKKELKAVKLNRWKWWARPLKTQTSENLNSFKRPPSETEISLKRISHLLAQLYTTEYHIYFWCLKTMKKYNLKNNNHFHLSAWYEYNSVFSVANPI